MKADGATRIRLAVAADRLRLAPLIERYEQELLPLAGPAASPRVPAIEAFASYWHEPDRHPFVIEADGVAVGFALVRSPEPGVWSVGEFFVEPEYRHTGIGQAAAILLFDRFPGQWRVAQLDANVPAQRFWRKVIARYTHGDFTESLSPARPKGPMQTFRSRGPGDAIGETIG